MAFGPFVVMGSQQGVDTDVGPDWEIMKERGCWEQGGECDIEFYGSLDHGTDLGWEDGSITVESRFPGLEEGVDGGHGVVYMIRGGDTLAEKVVGEEGPLGACWREVKVRLKLDQVDGLIASLKVEELFAAFGNWLLEGLQADHGSRGVII